jgi:DNA-binding NtrC family response regulator
MSINRRSKTLLVCRAKRDDVEQRLKSAGCAIIKVNDGVTAVARVRREMFDVAVLVSTGKAMDLVETVFNLKDIRGSMPIIVLCDSRRGPESPAAIPNVQYCSAPELQSAVKSARPGVFWTEINKQ